MATTGAPRPQRHRKAIDLADAGRLEEALQCLQEHLMACPRDPEALNDAAVVLHALGRRDEAAQHLQAAIALGGGNTDQAGWNLIDVHLASGRRQEVLALLDRLAEAGMLTAELANHAGARLVQSGDSANAVEAFARSLQVCPHQDAVRGLAEQLGSPGPAAGPFAGAGESSWNGKDGCPLQMGPRARGGAGERFRQYTSAKELGDCHAALGNSHPAKDCYRQAAYLAPDRPAAYLGLGVVAVQDDQLDLAGEAFEAALNIDPDCAEAYGWLAMIRQQQQDYHQAFDLYLKCLERDTDNMVALLGLFQTSCQMGTFARVIGFLEAYLKRHPADTAVLFCLATLYAREGRLHDAQFALQDVLAIEPDKPEATELLAQVRRGIRPAPPARGRETRPA